MAHLAHTATATVCELSLIQRAALALSEALAQWAETSAQSRHMHDGAAFRRQRIDARKP
jgi:hypothetical protein